MMDPSLLAAGVAAVVAFVTTFGSLCGQVWLLRRGKRLEADKAMSRFRNPFTYAANELYIRLGCILHRRFFSIYSGDDAERSYAVESTVWVVCQLLAWKEIIRREIQFLDVGNNKSSKRWTLIMKNVRAAFADTQRFSPEFRVFGVDQVAIGEMMMVERICEKGQRSFHCIGYSKFMDEGMSMHKWIKPIRDSFEALAVEMAARPQPPIPDFRIDVNELLKKKLADQHDYLWCPSSPSVSASDSSEDPEEQSPRGGGATELESTDPHTTQELYLQASDQHVSRPDHELQVPGTRRLGHWYDLFVFKSLFLRCFIKWGREEAPRVQKLQQATAQAITSHGAPGEGHDIWSEVPGTKRLRQIMVELKDLMEFLDPNHAYHEK